MLLYHHLKGEKLIDALRERLSDRPLRVEWHRFYQSAIEKERPDHDLAAEYRKLLDANPMEIPVDLVPKVRELLAKRRAG